MSGEELARRRFETADQDWFAELSGDWNPLHVDPLAARRSIFGRPVVHGAHLVLWALDAEWRARSAGGVARVRALFLKPALLGEELRLLRSADDQLEVHGPEGALCTVQVQRGEAQVAAPVAPPPVERPRVPRERCFSEAAGSQGALALYLDLGALTDRYPGAGDALGAAGVAGVCAASRLVGMELPGLHSLLSGLDLEPAPASGALSYEVVRALRPRLPLRIAFSGGGWRGHVDALFRPAPAAQPGAAEVAAAVDPGSFLGQRALVVGGSRGLGEVTAKAIAAGGGSVRLTYHRGAEEAERIARELEGLRSGCAAVARLDARERGSVARVVADGPLTHLYYFATPSIGSLKRRALDTELQERFEQIYVAGFRDAVEGALAAMTGPLRVFYPSSVAVTEAPESEYGRAKQAGERLCEALVVEHPRLAVLCSRLPRAHTDQTLSLLQQPGAPALDIMLPRLRRLHELEPGRVYQDSG